MRIPFLFAAALCYSLPVLATTTAPHERRSLDFDWRFEQSDPVDAQPLGAGAAIPKWRFHSATSATDLSGLTGDTTGEGFADASNGQNVFNGAGFAWFRATLSDKPSVPGPRILHFDGVDDNATVYLNGVQVGTHQGWSEPFDVDVSRAWKTGQPNELAVLVQNEEGPGGITGAGIQIGAVPPVAFARPDFNDAAWRRVDVPHDFVVENPFDPKGDAGRGSRKTGVGWYRKTFDLPRSAQGQSLWLDFDGVYRDATVYLNGTKLGNWKDGYAPFRVDISRVARFGPAERAGRARRREGKRRLVV